MFPPHITRLSVIILCFIEHDLIFMGRGQIASGVTGVMGHIRVMGRISLRVNVAAWQELPGGVVGLRARGPTQGVSMQLDDGIMPLRFFSQRSSSIGHVASRVRC